MRVLLIEDDALLGKALRTGLEQQGHAVDWVRDGMSGENAALEGSYSAVLLDLSLPRQDGMKVLANLRRRGYTQPVLIVTARDQIPDRVVGLDAGADDFIIKPFDLQELGARLRAAVRRHSGRPQPQLSHGPVTVDPAARQVYLAGEPVALPAREYALLLHLLQHAGRVQTRRQLEEALYSWSDEIESNAIEVYVHHLRRKLGKDLIRTVQGHGYVIPHDTAQS
ncbi:MAG TPA: response regulator [Steroidobacteraceae bacterium]|nr:response regulator [Steroidobacteraceae bacterium]